MAMISATLLWSRVMHQSTHVVWTTAYLKHFKVWLTASGPNVQVERAVKGSGVFSCLHNAVSTRRIGWRSKPNPLSSQRTLVTVHSHAAPRLFR
ncbi:MAG: hypothetical protein JWR15_2962 [Prosthecobacter sp.]|nr:hypothetical protein [Prosthecobacter sp.]